MKTLFRYLKIWWKISLESFMMVLSQKFVITFFLVGKVLRFIFFFGFLYFLLGSSKSLAEFSGNQVIFFFLTYTLIDTIAQFLFREVYRFRPLVISGDLDLILVKPMNPLFRVLMGGADVIDLITIPPLVAATWHIGSLLNPSAINVVYYLFLVLNGLLVATAFHIAVLAFGVITLEVYHTVMVYRDLISMGRFPIDIYKEPLKSVLTFLIPVGIMITLPAKALFGLISPAGVILSLFFGLALVLIAISFWEFALKKYSSASS